MDYLSPLTTHKFSIKSPLIQYSHRSYTLQYNHTHSLPCYHTAYAVRLDEILRRKQDLVTLLRSKLMRFRQRLVEEESIFKS